MIARPIDWTLAIAVSLGVHVAVASMYWSAPPRVEMERRAGSLSIVDGGLVNSIASEGAQAVDPETVQAVEVQPVQTPAARGVRPVAAQAMAPVPVERQLPAESVTARPVDAATATPTSGVAAALAAEDVATVTAEAARATVPEVARSVDAGPATAPAAVVRPVEPGEGRVISADVAKPVEQAVQAPAAQARPVARADRTPASSRSDTAGTRERGKQRAAQAGNGGSSAAATQGRAAESNYAGRVVARLQRAKRYPAAARRTRDQGTVRVRFTLDRSGRVVSASVAQRSGSAILDKEALALVRQAGPFPPFPAAIGKSRLTYTVPLTYRLR